MSTRTHIETGATILTFNATSISYTMRGHVLCTHLAPCLAPFPSLSQMRPRRLRPLRR